MDCIAEISKEIAKQIDMNLEKMFAMFGFTKEYLMNHADEFYVVEHGNVKSYFHNGKALFDEITTIKDLKFVVEYIPIVELTELQQYCINFERTL